jgi:hypothetical protein
MAPAAKRRPAETSAGRHPPVEPLEHRQLLSAIGGVWGMPRAHADVRWPGAVTVGRFHAPTGVKGPSLASARQDDAGTRRGGPAFGMKDSLRAAAERNWSGRGGDGNDGVEADWGRGRAGVEADEEREPAYGYGGGRGAQPAAVGMVVTHTEVVVGEEVVFRTGAELHRVFVPVGVVEKTEVVVEAGDGAAGGGAVATPAGVRTPTGRGPEAPANVPQYGAAEAPSGAAGAAGAAAGQNVSPRIAGGTDISPHLTKATNAAAPPRAAEVARAAVQGVAATSTAAVAAATRAAGELLGGGPSRDAAVVGAVEGVAAAAGGMARGAVVGSASGVFWAAMESVGGEPEAAQYVLAAAPLTAGRVATESVAALASKGAQVAAGAEQALPAAVEAAVGQLVPGRFLHIARIDALASFNDAMLAFIDDSAAMSRAVSHSRTRAWAVTAVVIAADAALLISWHRGRAKQHSKPLQRRPLVARA